MASGNLHNIKKRHVASAYQILKRLKNESLKEYFDKDGNVKPLTSTQLKAGELYMRKVLPDLKSVEHKGKIDNRIEVVLSVED